MNVSFHAALDLMKDRSDRPVRFAYSPPVISRVATFHHRIGRGLSFNVRDGQVIEQDVEFGRKQFAITRSKMLLEFCFVRKNATRQR